MSMTMNEITASQVSVIDSEVTLSQNSIVHLKDVREGDLIKLINTDDAFIVNYYTIGYNCTSHVFSTDNVAYELDEPYIVMVTADYTRSNREFFNLIQQR